jgi:uncharacterized protein (UPF0332 family)
MEQEKIESIEVELELAVENFESSTDDVKANRLRRATSGLYFTLEHLAKALLLTIGVEVESHGAVTRMLGLHFVKSANLSARVTRHLETFMSGGTRLNTALGRHGNSLPRRYRLIWSG